MKGIMMLALLVGSGCYGPPASEDQDYAAKLRTLLHDSETPEGGEAAEKYLESLSADQLIIAGRQCGREVQNAIDSGRPGAGEAVMNLAFFFTYYPRAADDLRDIGPILAEIRDKTHPAVWRSELSRSLLAVNDDDELSAKLTNDQRQQVFDCAEDVLNDKTESIYVRNSIPLRLARMLSKMYKDYSDAARNAAPDQRAETEKTLREFSERVGKYIDSNLKLFSDPTTPTAPLPLRQRLLGGAMICYREGLPGGGRVKDVVLQAFANYQNYPESLWPDLAQYAMEDFHIASANDVLDQMIQQTSGEAIKRRLQSLNLMSRHKETQPAQKEL